MLRRMSIPGTLVLMTIASLVGISLYEDYRVDRINGNESRAISNLKNLSSAQVQLQATGARDKNENSIGEFGDFADLEEFLSAAWNGGTKTRVVLQGYVIEVHLSKDPGKREYKWTAYAWPASYGSSGIRAFMVNQQGDILATNNAQSRYSGATRVPKLDAAFLDPEPITRKLLPAVNEVGRDGLLWTIV